MTRNINDAFEAMQETLEDCPRRTNMQTHSDDTCSRCLLSIRVCRCGDILHAPAEEDPWQDLHEWALDQGFREDAEALASVDLAQAHGMRRSGPHAIDLYELEAI